jgi:hypothetical protein
MYILSMTKSDDNDMTDAKKKRMKGFGPLYHEKTAAFEAIVGCLDFRHSIIT